MVLEVWVGWRAHRAGCEWYVWLKDSPLPSLRFCWTQTGLSSHLSLSQERSLSCGCNMSLHPSCSLLQNNHPVTSKLWGVDGPVEGIPDQQPGDLGVCPRPVPDSCVRCQHLWAAGLPSIIKRFIFSFTKLWLLFPFSDGVTNYFIIGFLKTSYHLFGSISKTLTWLSLILTVGLWGEELDGGP